MRNQAFPKNTLKKRVFGVGGSFWGSEPRGNHLLTKNIPRPEERMAPEAEASSARSWAPGGENSHAMEQKGENRRGMVAKNPPFKKNGREEKQTT